MKTTKTIGLWLLAFLGFPVGGLLAQLMTGGVQSSLQGVFAGFIAGSCIGTLQYMILHSRQLMPVTYWWIVLTALGFSISSGLAFLISGIDLTIDTLLIRGLVLGVCVGSLQYILAKDTLTLIWIPLLVVAFTLAWLTTYAIGVDLDKGWVVFGASGAVLFQLITGMYLYYRVEKSGGTLPRT